jgi:hypothetical protein
MSTATATPTIPLLRLDPADPALLEELLEVVARVASAGAFTMGHELEAFEAEFAAYCETDHAIGVSSEAREDPTAGAPLKGSEPLLVARAGHLHSPQPDPGTRIALTFDDGPDARWTPKVLEVLRRERVPAAFFMVGSQAARHPDLVRDVERAGHEVGNHTFTHAGMSTGPGWERRAQVDLT